MVDSYDDIERLLKDIKMDIEDTLQKEVLDEVKVIELECVEEDVLNSYSPIIYRRRVNGGINDSDNIIGNIDNMVLTVENITPFSSGYQTQNSGVGLVDLINGGDGYNGYYYDYAGDFNQARPFLDNTESEIEMTDRIDDALVKGLKNRKYDIV